MQNRPVYYLIWQRSHTKRNKIPGVWEEKRARGVRFKMPLSAVGLLS